VPLAAIETRGLTKYYGPVVGLENLSLEVAQGDVFGFLGANGAGKTTTIRMLLECGRPAAARRSSDSIVIVRDSKRGAASAISPARCRSIPS
jgi:ABC-2 type transport system ATP-binding protein